MTTVQTSAAGESLGMKKQKQSFPTRVVEYVHTHGMLHFLRQSWIHFWMLFAGIGPAGRLASWLVTWFAPPHYYRRELSSMNPKGFIAPSAIVHGKDIHFGPNIFVDDRCLIFQGKEGGPIEIGVRVSICRDTVIETGLGGNITIGEASVLAPNCYVSAGGAAIRIGAGVNFAPYCALYPHDHGTAEGQNIQTQPLVVKGDIVVEDGVWLGHGVTVLSGVRIGRGSVIGAGSTVASDVPEGAVAWGVPAKVFMKRKKADDASASKGFASQ